MFDRLQKPFLTVETGEAYQPIRLIYNLSNKEKITEVLNTLKCVEKNPTANSWTWYWKEECKGVDFRSLDSVKIKEDNPHRLGTFILRDDTLFLNLPSFKRACLAIPFFHKVFDPSLGLIHQADFINKVFALDERLPHGFSELFNEDELDRILQQRVVDYQKVKEECEKASSAEQAFDLLSDYTRSEAKKRLPYAERYIFEINSDENQDPEVLFLAFYIFLRGRELVAIKRWFGQSGYTLADAVDETIEQVFGGMGIDIIE